MAQFGSNSLDRLDTCHIDLQIVMREVISRLPWIDEVSGILIEDCTIIEGRRNEERQNYLFDTRKSQVEYPDSNHNAYPSDAVDSAVYHAEKPHIRWNDKDEFEAYSRLVLSVAAELGVNLRWGGDWDRDGVRVDKDPHEKFFDGPHFERLKDE
jgi:peptidoglycan L-alanyl-D-glutamate endopeptidase CwlK|tara:strand:+ start:2984 stop:3445 length:462 start_codon:yes stop_codon:yes gene_type:complete